VGVHSFAQAARIRQVLMKIHRLKPVLPVLIDYRV